jgi:hypothetical protein
LEEISNGGITDAATVLGLIFVRNRAASDS